MRSLLLFTLLFLFSCDTPQESNEPVKVVINEFLTSNSDDILLDEYGEADDWVEIYNRGDEEIDMSGFYLSDDSTNLTSYKFPDISIPPLGYLIIWADDTPGQGAFHAPFKLSSQDGDELILTKGNAVIDRIQFFPQSENPESRIPDVSYGRKSDGDPEWTRQTKPTPGNPNIAAKVEN